MHGQQTTHVSSMEQSVWPKTVPTPSFDAHADRHEKPMTAPTPQWMDHCPADPKPIHQLPCSFLYVDYRFQRGLKNTEESGQRSDFEISNAFEESHSEGRFRIVHECGQQQQQIWHLFQSIECSQLPNGFRQCPSGRGTAAFS